MRFKLAGPVQQAAAVPFSRIKQRGNGAGAPSAVKHVRCYNVHSCIIAQKPHDYEIQPESETAHISKPTKQDTHIPPENADNFLQQKKLS